MVSNQEALDNLWILSSAALVFFMQAGFCLLETGSVRPKNISNSLIKNTIACVIGAIVYYLIGYGLAFGDVDGKFAGDKYFAAEDFEDTVRYNHWMFHYAFASIATVIVSGAVAERITLLSYMIFVFFYNSFIYTVISAWVWGKGWLHDMDPSFIDFAGSGVVHMTGGFTSLIGILLLGNRLGRFKTESVEFIDPITRRRCRATLSPDEFKPSSQVYAVTGVFILWLGWLFFNAGSTNSFTGYSAIEAGEVMMNTILGGASGGIIVFFFKHPLFDIILKRKHTGTFKPRFDISALNFGILSGCVAITAGSANVDQWAALIIGAFGGIVYIFSAMLGEKLEIDDACDAFYVHGCGGIIGVILTSFLDRDHGVCYGSDGKQIGIQLLGIVSIIAWSSLCSFIIFGICKLAGILRVPAYAEVYGLDLVDNGVFSFNVALPSGKVSNLEGTEDLHLFERRLS
jgi:Amt family ammonium transporter